MGAAGAGLRESFAERMFGVLLVGEPGAAFYAEDRYVEFALR